MTCGMQQPDSFGNRISWSNSWLIFLMESGDPLCYGQHSASSLGVTTFTLPISGVTTSSSFLMELPPVLVESPPSFNLLKCEKTTTSIQIMVDLQLYQTTWWSYYLHLQQVGRSLILSFYTSVDGFANLKYHIIKSLQ